MQMHDYIARYDSLSTEEALFQIPLRKEYILAQIGKGKRVLDVGCLGGMISKKIMDATNEVWGVELNPSAANAARKRGVRVKVSNVEEGLPFEEGAFDVVHAGEILENLYDTKAFLRECRRVLKPQGFILFSATNLNSWENRLRVFTGGYLTMSGVYPEDHYGSRVRIFNLAKVKELCRQSGFVLEDTRGLYQMERSSFLMELSMKAMSKLLPNFSKLLLFKAVKK